MVWLSELAVVPCDNGTVVATCAVDEEGGEGNGTDGDGNVDSDDGIGDDDDDDLDGKGNGNDENEDGDGIKGDVANGSVGTSDNIVVDGHGVSETIL